MNPKTVIILVAVLGVAVLAYLLTQRGESVPNPNSPEQTSDSRDTDPPLLTEDVLGNTLRSITFDSGVHGTLLNLERIEGSWWVTKPSRFKANPAVIDELLTQLGGLTGRPAAGGPAGLVPDSPGLFLSHGLDVTQLFFNSRLGAGRAAVTVIQGPLTTDYNATDMLQDVFDELDIDRFYAKSFDPPLMPEVGRIDIDTPDGSSTLVQDEGSWWIEHESGLERVLETGLPGYPGVQDLFELFQAELIEKQSDNPASGMASYGLNAPLISARFTPVRKDPGQAYEVHIGTAADPDDQARYVSNGSVGQAMYPVFTMATEVALAFGQDATVFRDPRITDLSPTLIEKIDTKPPPKENIPLREQIILMDSDSGPALLDESKKRQPVSIRAYEDMLLGITTPQAIAYIPYSETQYIKLRVVVIRSKLGLDTQSFGVFRDPQSSPSQPTMLIRRGLEPILLRVSEESVAPLLDPSTLLTEDDR
ncbi:MAG: hypothetical protein AAGI37_02905 [Planctomycetota bacterium]